MLENTVHHECHELSDKELELLVGGTLDINLLAGNDTFTGSTERSRDIFRLGLGGNDQITLNEFN